MNSIYVAWQNEESREWTPVAKLDKVIGGYTLQYTRGSQRCTGFTGIGRMVDRDKVYFSEELFPFFKNRLISKSRPEYQDYLRWLGLENLADDPMTILAVTAGLRATDSLELIPSPKRNGDTLVLDFFPRGLSHMDPKTLRTLSPSTDDQQLYLMKDIQNVRDPNALALRTEEPTAMVGYLPRYYCRGLLRILDEAPTAVKIAIRQVNLEAPLDMRLLCRLTAPWNLGRKMIEAEEDFLPWTSANATSASLEAIERAVKAFSSNL